MSNCCKPKIGVLLYSNNGLRKSGAGTPDGTYEERMKRPEQLTLSALGEFADTVSAGIVYNRADLDRAMALFMDERVDGVYVQYLSWAPDALWMRFERDMPELPVLFASVVPERIPFENTFSANDSVAANTVRGLVGSLQASGSIARMDRPMTETVLGTLDEVMARAKPFFSAAHVRAKLKDAVVVHYARHHEVMWSTYVDGFSLFRYVGPEMKVLANATVRREMDNVSDGDVASAVAELKSRYSVMDDVDEDKLAASVRASLAVDRCAASMGADYVVMNDLDNVMHRELGLRPGFLPCPGGHGIAATPEGDVGAGTAAYILSLLSGRPAQVVEPGYINPETGLVDVGHGGPNDYTDPEAKVVIAKDTRLLNADVKYPGAAFAWQVLAPGVKTLLHLSQGEGGYKMAFTIAEAQDVDFFHASFCHGRLKMLTGTASEVFSRLLAFGTTQHYAIVSGDFRAELRDFAKIMGFKWTEA